MANASFSTGEMSVPFRRRSRANAPAFPTPGISPDGARSARRWNSRFRQPAMRLEKFRELTCVEIREYDTIRHQRRRKGLPGHSAQLAVRRRIRAHVHLVVGVAVLVEPGKRIVAPAAADLRVDGETRDGHDDSQTNSRLFRNYAVCRRAPRRKNITTPTSAPRID